MSGSTAIITGCEETRGEGRVQRRRRPGLPSWAVAGGILAGWGVKWAFAIAPVVTLLAVIWLAADAAARPQPKVG